MDETRIYWLVGGEVVTANKKNLEKRRRLNTLVITQDPRFTRQDLAKAQQALMHRYLNEKQLEKGESFTDVFIMSINLLGEMTEKEFNVGFLPSEGEKSSTSEEVN